MRVKSVAALFPRWFLVSLGVIALVFLTLFGVVRSLMPAGEGPAALAPSQPAGPLSVGNVASPQAPVSLVPATPSVAGSVASSLPPIVPSAGASPPPAGRAPAPPATNRPPRVTPPRAVPPAAQVTGRYVVFATFSDSFIGEVTLRNATSRGQAWTATLTFPANVGTLVASWLEAQPQPVVKQSGRTFTWTGSQPLAAGATGQLRFHLKRTGSGDRASTCAVNGAVCR
jgi:Cellulose binding domain